MSRNRFRFVRFFWRVPGFVTGLALGLAIGREVRQAPLPRPTVTPTWPGVVGVYRD